MHEKTTSKTTLIKSVLEAVKAVRLLLKRSNSGVRDDI